MNFVVPTGNFGDILAGYYAMRMGLPIARLLCASNRNNVLTDFFADGTYYTHRAFFQTMSPSMDILISSNLERLLFESTGRDPALVREWMALLSSEGGSFSIGAQRLKELKKTFWAGYADDFMTAAEIRRIFERRQNERCDLTQPVVFTGGGRINIVIGRRRQLRNDYRLGPCRGGEFDSGVRKNLPCREGVVPLGQHDISALGRIFDKSRETHRKRRGFTCCQRDFRSRSGFFPVVIVAAADA